MNIERGTGDLLAANVDALVNAVNTVGVMGKGIALQFKHAFPEVYASYKRACRAGALVPGRVHVVGRLAAPRFVINFPTKDHWRSPARLEFVREGLVDLVDQLRTRAIRSVAIPALGCGQGGLDWADVQPMIVQAFEPLPDVRVLLFEPEVVVRATAPQGRIRLAVPGRSRSVARRS